MGNGKIVLRGLVGSTAYGLATPDSDIDRLGVYVAPSADFWGFDPPVGKKASVVTNKPDMTYHEIGKFLGLCLKCNPTVTELLWLPDELYEVRGNGSEKMLIDYRESFLSAKLVRDAYLGYATQQFERLKNRGNGSFSSDLHKRTEKHARHLMRLLHQGYRLHLTGELPVRLAPEVADHVRKFGEQVACGHLYIAEAALASYETLFKSRSILPEKPDTVLAQQILMHIRRDQYEGRFDTYENLR